MIISSVKIYNRVLSPAEIWLKYMKEEKVKFCPSCGKIVSKQEGERCFTCLETGDKQRIRSGKLTRNESKNRANREAYRRCHPKKVIRNGKWVEVRVPGRLHGEEGQ